MAKTALTADLSSSLEDYLEAIYHIVRLKGAARPKDIGARLGVGPSSVTGALKALAERLLVNYEPYDVVTLTANGEEIARDVVHRHETLSSFFTTVLAVDPALAEEAACRMEHEAPPELMERLVRFIEFVHTCPRGGPRLLEGFRFHLESGCRPDCFQECPLLAGGDAPQPPTSTPPGETTLAGIPPGARAEVVRLSGEGSLRRRLMDLGLIPGITVQMVRVAPLGDPFEVVVKGAHLSIRREEAASVTVRPVE